jgi:hypothetical protein
MRFEVTQLPPKESQPVSHKMVTLRNIINASGTISDLNQLSVSVRFDLTEFQDMVEGMPGRVYSYGSFRFVSEHEHDLVADLLAQPSLQLIGSEVEATIDIHSPNPFKATGLSKEAMSLCTKMQFTACGSVRRACQA